MKLLTSKISKKVFDNDTLFSPEFLQLFKLLPIQFDFYLRPHLTEWGLMPCSDKKIFANIYNLQQTSYGFYRELFRTIEFTEPSALVFIEKYIDQIVDLSYPEVYEVLHKNIEERYKISSLEREKLLIEAKEKRIKQIQEELNLTSFKDIYKKNNLKKLRK